MPCKKSELVSAVNSFGSAKASADANLISFSVSLLNQFLGTLEFAEEDVVEEEVDATSEEK